MRRKPAVQKHIVPGWHDLLGQLSAPQKLTQAYARVEKVVSGTEARAKLLHSGKLTYIRSLIRAEGGQPTPKTVWKIAEIFRACGKEFAWCAGPLLLFGAGHFDLFARLMLQVEGLPRERKIKLVSCATGALRMLPYKDEESAIEEIKKTAWSREIKLKAIKQTLAQRGQVPVHLDRKIWELDGTEWGAFEHLFRRLQRRKKKGTDPPRMSTGRNPEIVANLAVLHLTALHPDAGLQKLRELTIWATLSALAEKAIKAEISRVITGYPNQSLSSAKLHG